MTAEPVVVVDDEQELLDFLTVLLQEEGYQTLSFADAPSVLELDGEQAPALFLLDLMLPTMNGIALAEKLRQIYPTVPILALSASDAWLRQAAASGLFEETVSKPFDLDDLLGVVARYAA